MMIERVLAYTEGFRCLAGDCPHTCCAAWEVVIDEETARRYAAETGPLGHRLRAALHHDGEDFCFPLDGGRCPFLNGENLCDIHIALGEEATSETCRSHPRFIEEYGPFREITFSASCPESNRLLLAGDGPIGVLERETGEPAEEGDPWLTGLAPLRDRMLDILRDRRAGLRRRLLTVLDLAEEGQRYLDEERGECLAGLGPGAWPEPEERPAPVVLEVPERGLGRWAMGALARLTPLDGDWRDLLARAAALPPVPVMETALERIAVYFFFRHILKAVNDGDLLGRVKLCILAVLAVEQLTALLPMDEALRRFCREVEHDEENVDTLLDWMWTEAALSTGAFRRALGEML